MNKEQVLKALEELKKQPKRKFDQSYDLIINLKNFEVKQHPIDFFVTLPFTKNKKIKVAAFVDQQLESQAEKNCDLTIRDTEFADYKDNKKAKALAKEYNYFIAQATLMPKIAAAFGKALGIRGKMPNPKIGCVVPPNANLEPLVKKLNLTVHLVAKKGLNLQCMIGKENQTDQEIVENFLTVYNAILKQLPSEIQNIKSVYLKLTMGKPIKV